MAHLRTRLSARLLLIALLAATAARARASGSEGVNVPAGKLLANIAAFSARHPKSAEAAYKASYVHLLVRVLGTETLPLRNTDRLMGSASELPDLTVARGGSGQVSEAAKREHYVASLESIRQAIRLAPHEARYFNQLAAVLEFSDPSETLSPVESTLMKEGPPLAQADRDRATKWVAAVQSGMSVVAGTEQNPLAESPCATLRALHEKEAKDPELAGAFHDQAARGAALPVSLDKLQVSCLDALRLDALSAAAHESLNAIHGWLASGPHRQSAPQKIIDAGNEGFRATTEYMKTVGDSGLGSCEYKPGGDARTLWIKSHCRDFLSVRRPTLEE
jgi:hypothetical protein